jgi:hypothetical protein
MAGEEPQETGQGHGSDRVSLERREDARHSLIIFIVSIVVMIVISYLTAPPSYEKISGLTYGTVTDEQGFHPRS